MNTELNGATVQVRHRMPAVDLAWLVKTLTDAICTTPDTAGGPKSTLAAYDSWPLFRWDSDQGVLRVNTGGVILRLRRAKVDQGLASVAGTGFMRDVNLPAPGTTSHIGGRIVDGSEEQLRQAVRSLMARIDADLDRETSQGQLDLSKMVTSNVLGALHTIAGRVGGDKQSMQAVTRLLRIRFDEPDRTARQRTEDLARLMAAVEEVDGGDRIEKLTDAVRRAMEARGLQLSEIDDAVASLRKQARMQESQVGRFFAFLEDAALARVRLSVSFHIMNAIAKEAARSSAELALAAEYIRRVYAMFTKFIETNAELPIELSAHYGTRADFLLSTELAKATFYFCLPVWCDWVTQIFEARSQDDSTQAPLAAREISYRFKVNGRNPRTQQSAFVNRVMDIREELVDNPGQSVPRRLAELVLLAVVIPATHDAKDLDVLGKARQIAAQLKDGGRKAVAGLLEDLEQRVATVDKIASAVISVLRTRGCAITKQTSSRSWDYYLCVRRGILNMDRASTGLEDPLARGAVGGDEQAEWFKHLTVNVGTPAEHSLFSLRVRVRLSERSLSRVDAPPAKCQVQRLAPPTAMQVCWRPYRLVKDTQQWEPLDSSARDWSFAQRIDIEYWTSLLEQNPKKSNINPQQALEMLAIYRAAFAVLVYTSLFTLLRRMRPRETDYSKLLCLMLRIQTTGRETESNSGSRCVYATSQAVEHVLGRDVRTHLQGFVKRNSANTRTVDPREEVYRKRGAYAGLVSALPIAMETPQPPGLDSIGVITFATRPCDVQPERDSLGQEKLLLIGRCYLARPIQTPVRGYRLDSAPNLAEVESGADAFARPSVVLERIRQLYDRGCRHIIFLSHRYGGRHIGRAALRHRHHDHPGFLQDIATRFPELTLYPMVRDVFPATRLRKRQTAEDGFEILQPDEHYDQYMRETPKLRTGLLPIYTLATLHVVGEELGRPQSGFATYYLHQDQDLQYMDMIARAYADLAPRNSTVREYLLAVLRCVHFAEAEKLPVHDRYSKERYVQPVLDPYAWMNPSSTEGAGEIEVKRSRRRGSVELSLTAMLAQISSVLHADRRQRDG